jgi:GntR family transcriptional regulator / MocR family aminotransferase
MSIEWTNSDPELSLRLDRAIGEPLRVQLERALRQSIQSGRLEAGERIPSTRRLAAELGISRGLVVDCYA